MSQRMQLEALASRLPLNVAQARQSEAQRVLQGLLAQPVLPPTRRPWLVRFARGFTALFMVQTLLAVAPAYAQITATPGAASGQKPLMDAAANGTPIVLVAPPSRAGVSRNLYEQFNVGAKGLILNNSTGNVQTQLGGWISGNLQLGLTPARIILNEVTGANASRLKGYIEIGGQKADLVIANPNGIHCDGCGFLNTGRATLATGTPQFGADGALAGLDLRQGVLSVGPGGLDATQQQQLDLMARSVSVDGEVFAQKLQAIIGANQVDYGSLAATPQSGNGEAPRFAVDIKDLGGMYAGQIYLIATEKGLGVNSTGRLSTLAGNLTLSVNGDLTLKDSYSAQDMQLSSAGKTALTGQTLAEGAARIDAPQQLVNSGALQAASLALNTPGVQNSGSIAQAAPGADLALSLPGGLVNSGAIYTPGSLSVSAASVTSGAADTAGGNLRNATGSLRAGAGLRIEAGTLDLQGQQLAANQDIRVQADTLRATASSLSAGGQVALEGAGAVELTDTTVVAGSGARVSGQSIAIDRSKIAALGNVQLASVQRFSADAADLSSNAALSVQGASVSLRAGTVTAVTTAGMASDGEIRLDASVVTAGRQVSLQGQGISTAGATVAAARVGIDAGAGTLNNEGGKVAASSTAADALSVSAAGIHNKGGELRANGGLSLDARGGRIDNTQGVIAGTSGTLTNLGGLSNKGGIVYTESDLNLSGTALDNSLGAIVTKGRLTVATPGSAILNAGGLLQADGAIALDAGSAAVDNSAGTVVAGGALSVSAGEVDTTAGTLAAGGQLDVTTGQLTGNGASLGSGGAMNLSVSDEASLSTAAANAGGHLTLSAGTVQASGAVFKSNGNTQVTASAIAGGLWQAQGDVTAATQGSLNVAGGGLLAGGNVSATGQGITTDSAQVSGQNVVLDAGAGTLSNVGGKISAVAAMGTALHVRAHGIDNTGGTLNSTADAILDASGQTLDNTGGTIQVTGRLQMLAGELVNRKGVLNADSALSLQGFALDNNGGAIYSKGNLSIDTAGRTLDNTGGSLKADGHTSLSAGAILSSGGAISAGTAAADGAITRAGTVTVRAASLDSSSGRISGTQELDILVTQRLAVAGATLETGGRLSAGAASIDAAGASLSAGAALSVIATGALDLTGASVKSAGDGNADLALSGESLAARGATVHGNAAVSLSSGGTLDAGAAQVSAVKALSITAPGAVTLEAGSFKANEQLALSGASVAAAGAVLSAGGRADITATAGAVDLSRATMLAGDAARVTATAIAAGAAVIGAVGSVTLQAGTGDFSAPKVLVQSQSGSISLNAATVNAAGSTPAGATPTTGFIAAQAIAITASGAVDVSEALTSAGASVAITSSGAIHNDGGRILANTTAELTGTTLGNQGGIVDATGPLRISVGAGQVVNDQGRISTRGVLTLTAPGGPLSSLSNAGGIIDTAGAFDVQLQNFNNAGGSVTALAGLSIAGGPVANTDGTLASNGSVSVNTNGGTFAGERGQVLSAEGNVTLITGAAALDRASVMAKGDITVNAAGAVTAGQAQIAAGGSASVTATTGIDLHSGSINAQTIGLQAGTGQINNTAGTLSAAATTGTALSLQSQGLLNDGGAIASGADLSVNAGAANLANAGGNILAVGAADIRSTGLDNTNGTIASNGALTINAAQANALADTDNTGGTIRSAQSSLSLTTGALANTAGQISAQGGNATLVVSSYTNNAGSVIAGGALSLNAGAGAITANAATFASGGAMTLRGGAAQFNDASVTAGGAIDAVVSSLQANRATVQAAGQLSVDAGGGAFTAANSIWKATQGVSLAGGNTTLSDAAVEGNDAIAVSGANIDATRASIATAADVRVQASGVLNMGEAALLAGQDLIATGTGAGVTAGASAMAGRDLVLGNAAVFDFAAPGMQFGFGRDLTVLAQGINTAGRTVAARRLTLDAGGGVLSNQGGTLQATDSLSASGTGLNNQAGVIAANGQVTVNAGAGALNNASGKIYSTQGSASVAGSGIQNSSGVIASVASTTADAGSGTLANTAGRVSGQNVAVGGAVNNASGVISGSSAVTMLTRELNNDAGVIESGAGGIDINTQGNTLSNTQSGSTRGIVSQGGIAIQAGAIDNQGGYIGANGGLNITQSASIDNRQGTLLGLGNSAITTSGVLNNAGGAIQSNADLTLNAATLNNSGAGSIVFANRNLVVNATAVNNTGNKTSAFTTGLLAGGNASISAATIDNTGGAIISLGDTSVVATGSVGNAGGQIAGNTVTIETPVLTNTGGRADAQRRMSLKVPQYSADGVLASNGDLELIMQGDQLNTGTFSANGSLSVSTTGIITNRGHISAQNRLSLTATGIDNAAGAIIDSQATILNTAGAVNNAGLINSTTGATAINAATLNNVGRVYGDSVVISGAANNGQDASGAGAVIASRAGDVSVGGAVNNTDGGYIFGLGDIRLNGPVWNDGSTLNASGNITIAGELRNSNAGLSVDTQTRSEAASGSYITPSGSTTRYSTAELGWRGDSGGHWVLPSATYPIATFGAEFKQVAVQCSGGGESGDGGCNFVYGTSDPIWT
ncbi:MAG: filamentous hemagglutinin N-terminal domain-containing protein, partial [Burkholderiaceae bacterium]|nr:filamentous hemagglutinin N-terminal domain-containing protein [Burkholderiaceae bacterium]